MSFHWGTENKSTPTSEQRELGRFAVEQGASLVLGHHPHVIQQIEVYQGNYPVNCPLVSGLSRYLKDYKLKTMF